MNVLFSIVLLSIVIESVTYAITKADLLIKPRKFLKDSSKFLNNLLSCGYCLSFWISLIVLSVSNLSSVLVLDESYQWINFIFCWFLLHRLSNVVHGAIDKYFDYSRDLRFRNMFTGE